MDDTTPMSGLTNRRDAIKIGGTSVTLAAFLAACGEDRGGSDEPGRIGNAPEAETLPEYSVDDAVLLRTASSLEYTAIAVYEAMLDLDGLLPGDMVPLVERLIEDHRATADVMVELTTAAGGEPWECPNEWFMARTVEPLFEAIQSPIVGVVQGEEADGRVKVAGEELDVSGNTVTTVRGELTIEDDVEVENGRIVSINGEPAEEGDEVHFTRPAEDMTADAEAVVIALENFAAASHQELVSSTSRANVDARVAHAQAAALEARHAAVAAIAVYGDEAYISPAILGEDVPPDADGQIRQFAISSTFGQTAQVEIKAGGADLNGVRQSFIFQTPAENSFVYSELEPSCSA